MTYLLLAVLGWFVFGVVFGLFFSLTIVCAVRGLWTFAKRWAKSDAREEIEAVAGQTAQASLGTPSPASALVREA